MTSSGTSPLCRCTCSACGATTLSAKRRNVSCTSSMSSSRWRRPGDSASAGDELRGAVGREERVGGVERVRARRPTAASRPATRAIRSCTASATKRTGDAGLGVALGRRSRASPAPSPPPTRRGRCRRRAPAGRPDRRARVEAADGRGDHTVGESDDVGRGGQVRQRSARHRRDVTDGRFAASGSATRVLCTACSVVSATDRASYLRLERRATPAYLEPARRLGEAIAAGASASCTAAVTSGLMGAVADAVLAGGGEVVGVIPEHLVAAEIAHRRAHPARGRRHDARAQGADGRARRRASSPCPAGSARSRRRSRC